MIPSRVIFIWFLPFILLISGCAAPGIAPRIDIPPSLVHDSETAARQVQDCHLRVDLELANSLLTDRQVLEIWYARPDRIRLEVLESAQPGFQDVISASTGPAGWTYQHATNRVDVGPIGEVKPAIVYDLVFSALDQLFAPEQFHVQDVAVDYVNREWAFKLSGTTTTATCTVWLNAGSMRPVQLRYQSESLGTYTMTINAAEYDVGLTDDIFDLTLLPTNDYTIRSVERPTTQTSS